MPTKKQFFFDFALGVFIGLVIVAGLTLISCRMMETYRIWQDVQAAQGAQGAQGAQKLNP